MADRTEYLLRRGGFECANDFMTWLNTLEETSLRKTDLYAWAMDWRPKAYLVEELRRTEPMSATIFVDRRAIGANQKPDVEKLLPVFQMKMQGVMPSGTVHFMSGSVHGALYLDYDWEQHLPYMHTEGEIEMTFAIRDGNDAGRSFRKHTIHVNRAFISQNRRDGIQKPVYTIKTRGVEHARYARAVLVPSYSDLVYSSAPISGCGARVWVETDDDIELVDEMTYQQAKEIGA